MSPGLNSFFQSAPDGGQRLYLHHRPPSGQSVNGVLVYVHPWAEEMNKSRRMAALASRSLAAQGWAVLQVDLRGCGDSSGDLADATWPAWQDDVVFAAHWLRAHHPGVPLWLWGLRAGALLANAAAQHIGGPVNFLFWQPALQGKLLLQQFFRLKATAQLTSGRSKAILETVRADLAAGRTVDVAGYAVSAAMAQGFENAALEPPPIAPGRVVWLDVSAQAEPALSPATQAASLRWQTAGWQLDTLAVTGPSFWQTTEIEDAPALIAATQSAMRIALPAQDRQNRALALALPP